MMQGVHFVVVLLMLVVIQMRWKGVQVATAGNILRLQQIVLGVAVVLQCIKRAGHTETRRGPPRSRGRDTGRWRWR